MRHHFIATNWTADSNIFVVFLAKRRYSRCMYGRCKDIYRWIDPLNTSTRLLAVRLFEILVSDPLGAKSALGPKTGLWRDEIIFFFPLRAYALVSRSSRLNRSRGLPQWLKKIRDCSQSIQTPVRQTKLASVFQSNLFRTQAPSLLQTDTGRARGCRKDAAFPWRLALSVYRLNRSFGWKCVSLRTVSPAVM